MQMVPKPPSGATQNTFYKTERSLNKTQRAQQPARRKKPIPQALKWQTWIRYAGENFKAKCATPWCRNIMNVTNFQAGHRQAEATGGPTMLENLIPICASCNQSMGIEHFDIWSRRGQPVRRCCFSLTNLWRFLRGQKTAYPVVTATASPLNASTPPQQQQPQPQQPIPGWGGTEVVVQDEEDNSQESDVCIQGDTYHPPPLQPAPQQRRIV
jgi:hypothetical protein